MIRHRRSLLISITIHTILLLIIFFTWRHYYVAKTAEPKKKVCLKLSSVSSNKELEKPKPKELEKPKPKVLEKPKPKKIKRQKKVKTKKLYEVDGMITEIVPEKLAIVNRAIRKRVVVKKKEIIKKRVVVKKRETIKKRVVVKKREIVKKMEVVRKKRQELPKDNKKTREEKLSNKYIKINTKKIAQLLKENLYYPRSARKKSITGDIVVKFTLGTDSRVYDIKIVDSKSEILSRAAMKTIQDLSGKFPKPEKKLILNVPINYDLKE